MCDDMAEWQQTKKYFSDFRGKRAKPLIFYIRYNTYWLLYKKEQFFLKHGKCLTKYSSIGLDSCKNNQILFEYFSVTSAGDPPDVRLTLPLRSHTFHCFSEGSS